MMRHLLWGGIGHKALRRQEKGLASAACTEEEQAQRFTSYCHSELHSPWGGMESRARGGHPCQIRLSQFSDQIAII